MREEWSLQLIAVQHNAPHILVVAAVVVGYHLERLAVFQMNGRLVEQRRPMEYTGLPGHT